MVRVSSVRGSHPACLNAAWLDRQGSLRHVFTMEGGKCYG